MSSRATVRVSQNLRSLNSAAAAMACSDGDLLMQAATGDPAAFQNLACDYDHAILSLLLALTRSEQDALHLCHATLMTAYRNLPVRKTCSLFVWLHRLAALQWLEWAKKNGASAAAMELSARERLVFTLKCRQHLTLSTVAQIVDESEEAVGRTFTRAVCKLRLTMNEAR